MSETRTSLSGPGGLDTPERKVRGYAEVTHPTRSADPRASRGAARASSGSAGPRRGGGGGGERQGRRREERGDRQPRGCARRSRSAGRGRRCRSQRTLARSHARPCGEAARGPAGRSRPGRGRGRREGNLDRAPSRRGRTSPVGEARTRIASCGRGSPRPPRSGSSFPMSSGVSWTTCS